MAHLITYNRKQHSMDNCTDVEGYDCDACDKPIGDGLGYINIDHPVSGIDIPMCRDCVRSYE